MNVVAFIISLALFLGGIFLFGQAFAVEQHHAFVFAAGIALVSIAIAIPVHVLKRIDS